MLALAAGTLAYLAVLALLGAVNRRDRQRLGELVAQLRARRERRVAPSAEQAPELAG